MNSVTLKKAVNLSRYHLLPFSPRNRTNVSIKEKWKLQQLTVHVLAKPVLPAALDVLLPSLRASGSFSADQLAQLLDPADVLDGRVAAPVPNDGGQVDRGAALAARSLQD